VGENLAKEPLLTLEQRVEALRDSTEHLSNVRVESFRGLLVDYARSIGSKAIVRGLRATSDFEYEFQMAMVNRRLDKSVETVFLMTKWEYSYLTSSVVREVAQLGGDVSEMVPPPVNRILREAVLKR
jgi:pantetheine-phosphate adenylyltransferase